MHNLSTLGDEPTYLFASLIFQGSEDIEGIFLDISNMLFDVKPAAFINMLNLRFLKIYCPNYENLYGLCLPKGLQSLPNELRLLRWDNYPLASLPQDFEIDLLLNVITR